MKCSQIERIISAHLDGEVSPIDWENAKAHIDRCSQCTRTLIIFNKIQHCVKHELFPRKPPPDLWLKAMHRL
ncbi:MAG: zf-HC2 domain-containing protein [bacterium]